MNLVVTEIDLPEIDGVEMMRCIRVVANLNVSAV